ncbi:PQQ-binding-like beta-propeller repeat protein [Nonomuraea rubra]|uniref:Outer membrane protein assembly factor BamB n=1 Tax=Nonomuraea rubra TaxID=46180 RepID=A0A7X0NP22_9ACTN|nr:PQQ-binding-like beta-propeller repeat protein [Nonomuraea rubra]MBB6546956.1 outer membrane protein assembly factor BamB [Nonomuraea rubra]
MDKHRVTCTWWGGGLALCGTALTAWAYFLYRSVASRPDPPELIVGSLIAAALLFALLIVAQVQAACRTVKFVRSEASEASLAWEALNAANRAVRHWAWMCAAALAIPVLEGGWQAFEAIDSGFPVFGDFAFAVSSAITLIGLALHGSGDSVPGSATRKIVGAGAGLVTAAAVMAATFAVAATPLWADATTATAPGRPAAAVPETVGKIAWRWKSPNSVREPDVVTASGGIVVQVRDGVVALDSTTGRERWRHRRPGAVAYEVRASPDGRTVTVAFWPGEGATDQADRLAVLDAATGEVRAVHADAWGGVGYTSDNVADGVRRWQSLFALGRDTAVTWSEDGSAVTGWDVETSQTRWRHTLPENCTMAARTDTEAAPVMLRDVVAVAAFCGQDLDDALRHRRDPIELQVVMLGLDPLTGSEVWRHQSMAKVDLRRVTVHAAVDAQAVAVIWRGKNLLEDYRLVLAHADGHVLNNDHAALDGWDLRSAPFTGEGWLRYPRSEALSDYGWEPFQRGEPQTASVSLDGLPRKYFHPRMNLPLTRALVTTRPELSGSGDVALITPWGTRDTQRFPLGFASPGGQVSLFPAPGAVVAVSTRDTMVVGLN